MKCLVAGGAGMIGSNVASILVLQGHHVWISDLKTGEDLSDLKVCRRVCEGMDRVFHLADRTVGVGYSSTHHGQMMTDSLLISLNLLKAAQEAKVKDYLYVSTSCVYDGRYQHPVEEDLGWMGPPESANEGYGWAKRIAEKQCIYFVKEHGMRVVIARPANVFGPSYDWTRPIDDMHVIPSLICKMLRQDREIVVWGSGKQTRTFQYEHDTASLIVSLADKGESGKAYNLGGEEVAIQYMAQSIANWCDYHGEISCDTTKPEGPTRKAQNSAEVVNCVGDFPYTPFYKSLQLTVAAAKKALSL